MYIITLFSYFRLRACHVRQALATVDVVFVVFVLRKCQLLIVIIYHCMSYLLMLIVEVNIFLI